MPDLSPPPPSTGSPQAEHRYHDYIGNAIPWYVRVIWIGFWVFVASLAAITLVWVALRPGVLRRLAGLTGMVK